MSTKFGSAGIPGTRLKVCVWGVGGGGWWWITYPLLYNTSPRLGAGALMLNAWTGLLQKFFKVRHVGTQNLKLELLNSAQKSVFNSDLHSLNKCPKRLKIQPFSPKWLNFEICWTFTWAMVIKIENSFLHCVQHLELQVLSTHMPYD